LWVFGATGAFVGLRVGNAVGFFEGLNVGDLVGARVGFTVGKRVGAFDFFAKDGLRVVGRSLQTGIEDVGTAVAQ
jgi:hypothetical protein